MNFEQELKELIWAALKAGVDREVITDALEERAAWLTEMALEEVEEFLNEKDPGGVDVD